MDSLFFPGLRILFVGHGECLAWYKFCTDRGIANLGFPAHVEIRVLACQEASVEFLLERASSILSFSPHVIISHLGMSDLRSASSNPLATADRYWFSLGHLLCKLSGPFPPRVIFIAQPPFPHAFLLDGHFSERVNAFHSRLLCWAENSEGFSFIFMEDILEGMRSGLGIGGARLGDVTPNDMPYHFFLTIIKRRVALVLPSSKYVLLFVTDGKGHLSPFKTRAETFCESRVYAP